jgi:antitoxin (DNA-binding transcriptional repressor) of toxin-antitoxin stability system
MPRSVDVSELRASLDAVLARVAGGERLVVTDRNGPVAEPGPVSPGGTLERLIAEGKVIPASRPALDFQPIKLVGSGMTLSEEVRGGRHPA